MSKLMEEAAWEIQELVKMPDRFRIELDPVTDNIKIVDMQNAQNFGCIVTRKCVEDGSHFEYVRDAVAKALPLMIPRRPEALNTVVSD